MLLPLILYHLGVARRENNDLLGDVLEMLYGRITRQAAARSARLAVPAELVLIARPSIAPHDYAAVERDYLHALRRAKLLVAEPAPLAPVNPS